MFDWPILDAEGLRCAACIPGGSVRGAPEQLCAKRGQPLWGGAFWRTTAAARDDDGHGIGFCVPRPPCIQNALVKRHHIYVSEHLVVRCINR